MEAISFTPKDQKAINLLIKGINNTFDESDVEGCLREKFPDVKFIKISRFSTQNSKKIKKSWVYS